MNREIKIINSIKGFFVENFRKPEHSALSERERIEFIDLAKGVCIILVVILHSTEIDSFLRALRMPFYFVISGLFFKDYGGLLLFLRKKLNKIIIPCCFFVMLPFLFRFMPVSAFRNELIMPFKYPVIANFPMWFLLCLFWTNVIYCVICLSVKKFALRLLIVLAVGFTGFMLSRNQLYLPLFLGGACSATPFFFIGVVMRKLPILYKTDKDNLYRAIGVLTMAAAIAYCCYVKTPYLEFRLNAYIGNIIKIYAVSISMVIGLLMLCKMIGWLPIISYMGRYSIIVLGFHYCYLVFIWKHLPLHEFKAYTDFSYGLFSTAVVLMASWVSIPICRRYLPHLTAQKDLI